MRDASERHSKNIYAGRNFSAANGIYNAQGVPVASGDFVQNWRVSRRLATKRGDNGILIIDDRDLYAVYAESG